MNENTMESIHELISKMLLPDNFLPIIFISSFCLIRCHIYRDVRKFIYPIFIFVIGYRAYFSDGDIISDNFLSYISNWLKSHLTSTNTLNNTQCNNTILSYIIGDLFGLILFIRVLDIINDNSNYNLLGLKKVIIGSGFDYLKLIPYIANKLKKEMIQAEKDFEKDLKPKSRSIGPMNLTLPHVGMKHKEILDIMRKETSSECIRIRDGKISGAVYHGEGTKHQDLLNEAFGMYSLSNPLHADLYPSVMKFEAEIVAMTASLVRGTCNTVVGSTTSGGTESILLAIKAHREFYRINYGITKPELIACITAHAAVDKACELMNIKLIHVPMDPNTCQIDMNAVKDAIGPNTIMLYGSAPQYPQGVIDPLSELSKLAVKYRIGLHVDCCLGGFFLPFAKKLGYNVPEFDFSLPGVTSMSLDTHKYGYALKGASVMLCRTKELRQSQYFCYAEWTGGLYATPGLPGSRSGGLIAQCWASLVSIGETGYLNHTRDIIQTVKKITDGIREIDGIEIIGKSEAMIVCFKGVDGINVYSISDMMSKKYSWALCSHQSPPCVHICCTVVHVGKEDELLANLRDCVAEVRANPSNNSGNAAIYGMTASLPAGPVNEMLKIYNDVVLKC